MLDLKIQVCYLLLPPRRSRMHLSGNPGLLFAPELESEQDLDPGSTAYRGDDGGQDLRPLKSFDRSIPIDSQLTTN